MKHDTVAVKRRDYDLGVPSGNSRFSEHHFEYRDPNEIFREFFGGKDPFEAFFGNKDPFEAFFADSGNMLAVGFSSTLKSKITIYYSVSKTFLIRLY